MMRAILVALALSLVSAPAFAQKLDASGVDRAMKKVLAAKQLQQSKVGIFAIDVETNEVVYDLNAGESFNPASNMKLFTAAVALEELGPEQVFVTRVKGKQSGSTIKGDIHIVGAGDPLLMWEDLLKMASELRALGITKIEGGVVVDDSAFTGGFIPPGFDQKDEDASYRAPVGALSLNYNAQTVVVRPGSGTGEPAIVYLNPPNDYTELDANVSTSAGTRAALKASAKSGDRTKVSVSGKVGLNANPQFIRKRIDNPSLFAGSAFKTALKTAGIEVGDDVKVGNSSGATLVQHESPPVAYMVFLMNKWSNNFIAEMLFQHVASEKGPDNSKASPAVVERFVKRAGIDAKGFKSFNGSGLYDGNLVTPKQLVQLLDWMTDQPEYPEFAAALPVAGTDGTLAKRLGNKITRGTLRGKTGTLNQVTALAGYLQTKSGRTLAYAVLINDPPTYAWRLRRMQDELTEALAGLDN